MFKLFTIYLVFNSLDTKNLFSIWAPFINIFRFILRCDCPTDVILIGRDSPFYAEVQKIPWRHVPFGTSPPLQSFHGKTADSWKAKGNELFKRKSHREAREAYHVALQMGHGEESDGSELTKSLHLNLAQTCLDLGYFEQVLVVSWFVFNIPIEFKVGFNFIPK